MPRKSSKVPVASSKGAAKEAANKPRQLPLPQRIWYKPWTWVRNLPAPQRTPLPKARYIVVEAVHLIIKNWKVFGGIALFYGACNVLFVSGLYDPTNLSEFKDSLSGVFTGTFGQVQTITTSFLVLVTTSNSTATESSGLYQTMLLLIGSLAIIWALRQVTAGNRIRIRDAFYRGMYPLVPFFLVLIVLSLQLIPAVIGGFLYATAVNNGIANDIGQKAVFALVFAGLTLWTLRMVTGAIFALYIVTLPDMTPLKALRSARDLVYKRRLLIWRKLIFLPVVLLVSAALIELPLILFLTPLAYWVFFLFSTVAVVFFHGFLYTLYRKLL